MNDFNFGSARVAFMRATAFFKSPRSPLVAIFEGLTGSAPSGTTQDSVQALFIEQGRHPSIKGASLRVLQQGARIDIIVEPVENSAPTNISDITLSSEAALSAVKQFAEKVFLKYDGIVRIAFHGNFVFSSDKDAPFLVAGGKLPHLANDLINSSEFNYKINRRTDFDGFLINRLSNWEVAHFFAGQKNMQAAPVGASNLSFRIPIPTSHLGEFLSVEVECNTDAARTETIDKEKLAPIFNRLITETATIVNVGHK